MTHLNNDITINFNSKKSSSNSHAGYPLHGNVDYKEFVGMAPKNVVSLSQTISTWSFISGEVIAENLLEENGRISLAYENLSVIPRKICEKLGRYTKVLDLSFNNFENLSFLSFFDELHTLILDRNKNLDINTFPFTRFLKILWINNCDILNIEGWIYEIALKCPSLQHLSLMGNPGTNKNFIYPNEERLPFLSYNKSYEVYREYILNLLPDLKYLNGVPIFPINVESSFKSYSEISPNTVNVSSSPNTNQTSLNSLRKIFIRKRKNSYQSSSTD